MLRAPRAESQSAARAACTDGPWRRRCSGVDVEVVDAPMHDTLQKDERRRGARSPFYPSRSPPSRPVSPLVALPAGRFPGRPRCVPPAAGSLPASAPPSPRCPRGWTRCRATRPRSTARSSGRHARRSCRSSGSWVLRSRYGQGERARQAGTGSQQQQQPHGRGCALAGCACLFHWLSGAPTFGSLGMCRVGTGVHVTGIRQSGCHKGSAGSWSVLACEAQSSAAAPHQTRPGGLLNGHNGH